ncbi:MAG: hypothetical protein K8I82_31535 [Anaerolineae bacterium]|nr:hypothetical protein [Anaerolineae bacterium]
MKHGQVWLLALVVVLIAVMVMASSITLLPDPPLNPTPTFPKAIDFPNERPVPHR